MTLSTIFFFIKYAIEIITVLHQKTGTGFKQTGPFKKILCSLLKQIQKGRLFAFVLIITWGKQKRTGKGIKCGKGDILLQRLYICFKNLL